MFGQVNKPVVFDPYRGRRSGWRMPRWLLLLLIGAAGGAGGLFYVQQRVLPPHLTVDESERIQNDALRADTERQRLRQELANLKRQFEVAMLEGRRRDDELAASKAGADKLRADLAAAVASLPPDPRGGEVEVRAGRFAASAGALAYDLVLTRKAASRPLAGTLRLMVAGTSAEGRESTVALAPQALSVGAHEVLHGSAKLPEHFTPRQTTVQVLDRSDGRALGMRVLRVE
jgi:hypothetical protein